MEICEVFGRYLAEIVKGSKGNVVSFAVGDIARWAEERHRIGRSIMFKLSTMAEALLAAGLLERIGKKYLVKRGSALWVEAKEEDVAAICDLARSALLGRSRVVR